MSHIYGLFIGGFLVGDLGRLLDDGARLAVMGGFPGLLNKQAVIAE